MISLSLCMIVKNEEKVLKRCLESVKNIVDEIIIVDTGSTDKTKDIAKKFTKNIYDFKWIDDFAAARNYSFSKATKEYIMWLDADDVILKKDREKLLKLKENLDRGIDMVLLKYNTGFDENGNVNFSYYRERILKREKNYTWISPIHEVIPIAGKTLYSDICITHKKPGVSDPKRNLRIFENMIKSGISLDPRQQFYYARELYYAKEYNKSILQFTSFLERKDGWIENRINACLDLYHCYMDVEDTTNAFLALTRSFMYDTPRAEICCELGNFFLNLHNYINAAYWYKMALTIPLDTTRGGFYTLDCYKYIPYIQLCVCYYNLNDIHEAKKYNELAGKEKPLSQSYLHNKEFFEKLDANTPH